MIVLMKRRKSLFLLEKEDYRGLFHCMKHYEKEDFLYSKFLPKENPFFDSQFSKYNFEEQIFTTSYLVILVQKGIKIFVFARSQNNEKWS